MLLQPVEDCQHNHNRNIVVNLPDEAIERVPRYCNQPIQSSMKRNKSWPSSPASLILDESPDFSMSCKKLYFIELPLLYSGTLALCRPFC